MGSGGGDIDRTVARGGRSDGCMEDRAEGCETVRLFRRGSGGFLLLRGGPDLRRDASRSAGQGGGGAGTEVYRAVSDSSGGVDYLYAGAARGWGYALSDAVYDSGDADDSRAGGVHLWNRIQGWVDRGLDRNDGGCDVSMRAGFAAVLPRGMDAAQSLSLCRRTSVAGELADSEESDQQEEDVARPHRPGGIEITVGLGKIDAEEDEGIVEEQDRHETEEETGEELFLSLKNGKGAADQDEEEAAAREGESAVDFSIQSVQPVGMGLDHRPVVSEIEAVEAFEIAVGQRESSIDEAALLHEAAFAGDGGHFVIDPFDGHFSGDNFLLIHEEGDAADIMLVVTHSKFGIWGLDMTTPSFQDDFLVFEIEREEGFVGGNSDGIFSRRDVTEGGADEMLALDSHHGDGISTGEIVDVSARAEHVEEDIFHGGGDGFLDITSRPGDELIGEDKGAYGEDSPEEDGGPDHGHDVDAGGLDSGQFLISGEASVDDADGQEKGGWNGEGEETGDDVGKDLEDLYRSQAFLHGFTGDADEHEENREGGEGQRKDLQEFSQNVSLQEREHKVNEWGVDAMSATD